MEKNITLPYMEGLVITLNAFGIPCDPYTACTIFKAFELHNAKRDKITVSDIKAAASDVQSLYTTLFPEDI